MPGPVPASAHHLGWALAGKVFGFYLANPKSKMLILNKFSIGPQTDHTELMRRGDVGVQGSRALLLAGPWGPGSRALLDPGVQGPGLP